MIYRGKASDSLICGTKGEHLNNTTSKQHSVRHNEGNRSRQGRCWHRGMENEHTSLGSGRWIWACWKQQEEKQWLDGTAARDVSWYNVPSDTRAR